MGCRGWSNLRSGTLVKTRLSVRLDLGGRKFLPCRRVRYLYSFNSAFLIEVDVEFFLGRSFGKDPLRGDLHSRGPDDGVENGLAYPIDRPAFVVVASYKPNAPAPGGTLVAPHQGLRLAQSLYSVLVPHVNVAVHVLAGRNRRKEIQYLVSLLNEAHVIVPLV